jgi:putative tricarboxylic transport membrane protein
MLILEREGTVRIAEIVAALCVALFGATTIALASQLPYGADYGPGPGFLPFWLGITLVVLSAFLLRDAVRTPSDADSAEDRDAADPVPFFHFVPGAFTPWLIFVVSTVTVSLLFERLGFALSTGLFMLVTMRWIARQSWRSTILFAVVTPIVLYIGFVRILKVPIPLEPVWF